METEISFDEDDFYRRVLASSQKRFVSDADPVTLLDVFLQTEFIDHDLYRDISELGLTSQKNRKIIETVCTKGREGYRRFKKCLRESDQGHLADHLERNEKEMKPTMKKKPTLKVENVSDEDLAKISNAIGKNWELLAPTLGLIDTEVDHLEMNYGTVQVRIYQMLKMWKKRNGNDSTLENLLSKIKSMPSVNVNMDFINKNVSSAAVATSDERSKYMGDMHPTMKSEFRVQPVVAIPKKEVVAKYKQIEEQSWSSNVVDGVSPIKERSDQFQEESNNKSEAVRLKTVNAEDQIDSELEPMLETTETEVKASYENLNVRFNSEASGCNENRPTQETGGLKNKIIKGIIDDLHSKMDPPTSTNMQGNENNSTLFQSSHQMQTADIRLSENIKVDLPAESNDEIPKRKLQALFGPLPDRRKSIHDGRLLILEGDVCTFVKHNYSTQTPIEGGYGCVYISKEKIPELDMKVALKEIVCNDEKNKNLEKSTTNEKLASRIMHFATVPLLAMGMDKNKGIYWFLSPCLDMGDLNTLIENDTRRIEEKSKEELQLNRQRRLKIIYHISAAIDFLHTEIKSFRGAIIHLDVKTKNVVLDKYYNARLTDFGIARETTGNKTSICKTKITVIPTTLGYFDPPSHNKLVKYFDYYNIGVVIRELLTGKPARFQDHPDDPDAVYLKHLDKANLRIYIQKTIWYDEKRLCKAAERVLNLSQQCINTALQSEETKDEKFTSVKILKEMEEVVTQFCDGKAWERSSTKDQTSDDDKCEMCMANSSVATDLLSHADCPCPLKVCVSCMRNSYLNPLRCHSCFREIEPIIGSNWGAVLVGGRYDNNVEFSKSCSDDIDDIQKVIISKCPLVIGIRKSSVRKITQESGKSSEQSADFTSQVQRAFHDLNEDGVRTIFFYFSGQYSNANEGFVMQTRRVDASSEEQQYTSEYLHLSEFKEMLRLFSQNSNGPTDKKRDKSVIVILDCAEAPLLVFESDKKMYKNIVQLNACESDQRIAASLFKKIFIQGLTKKSTKNDCFLQKYRPCDICPIKGEDFITIGTLNTYISRHMEAYHKHFGREPPVPVQYAASDAKIGYLVETSAELQFTLTFSGMQKDCPIACHFFNEINQLKEVLFNEFMEKMKIDKEKENGTGLQLRADDFKDILQIIIKTGPNDTHKFELSSLEQILSAWNGKRELYVGMRDMSMIKNGMVGVFRETEPVLSPLHENNCEYKTEEDANRTIYIIDVEIFLELDSTERHVKHLQKGILKLTEEEREHAVLHIILPSMTDANGVRHRRGDFVCFKIEKHASRTAVTEKTKKMHSEMSSAK